MLKKSENNLLRVIMLSAVAALGGFLFGFDSGVINGTVDALQGAFGSDAIGTGFDAWQWMFWIEIIPASVFFFSLLFIPESPRYLVAANKAEKAIAVLASITNWETAREQVTEIKKTVSSERKPRLSDIINQKTKKVNPIVWIGIGLAWPCCKHSQELMWCFIMVLFCGRQPVLPRGMPFFPT